MIDLKKLRADTNAVIASLKFRPENEAVNWADLHCTEAQLVVNDQGSQYCRVLIQEAAPECSKLCKLILEGLTRAGWGDEKIPIWVTTEW